MLFPIRSTLLALSLFSASALADPPEVNQDRVVAIDGPIVSGNVLTLLPNIEKMAAESDDPIDIVIASPGGDVITGSFFVNELRNFQARGIRFRCFVPLVAASMAFQLLTHCDERYALDRALLLWHRARILVGGGIMAAPEPITAPLAHNIAASLYSVDQTILRELLATLGMPEKEVRYHLENETLHFGENLSRMAPNFIKSYPHIPGLMQAWRGKDTPRLPKKTGLFDLLQEVKTPGSFRVIHIWLPKK